MSNTVIICIALIGTLIFVLGANVTRERAMRGEDGNQMPSDPTDRLLIAQRAHGNAAEYVPTMIGLLILCSTLTEGWWLDSLAIASVVARLVHAAGTLGVKSLADHWPARDLGAFLTYATGIALGITAIVAL